MSVASATRSHHEYAAIDLPLSIGRALFAMVDSGIYEPGAAGRCGNTVIVSRIDGARYTYCHLSAVAVAPGDTVTAGQAVGSRPVLLAIVRGSPIPPTAAPTSGCYTPQTSTGWSSWLDRLTLRAPTAGLNRPGFYACSWVRGSAFSAECC